MCNINLIYNKGQECTKLISEVMTTMSWMSWQTNNDGEGFFGMNENGIKVVRNMRKMRFIKKYYLLASHQRIGTSGKKNQPNAHPHSTENLILLHNGNFVSLGNDKMSDTHYYLKMLDRQYRRNGGNIIRAIKKVCKMVSGTYSIIVCEKRTGNIYYYKERCTSMYKVQGRKWLILSTRKENVEYAKFRLKIKGNIEEIKELRIYDVLNNFRQVSKFKEKSFSYSTNDTYIGPSTSNVVCVASNDKQESLIKDDMIGESISQAQSNASVQEETVKDEECVSKMEKVEDKEEEAEEYFQRDRRIKGWGSYEGYDDNDYRNERLYRNY